MIGGRLRPFLIHTGMVLLSVLAALGLGEIILRAAHYSYTPLRIAVQNKTDWRQYHTFEDSSFISDSYLIWRPKPNAAIFNSQGYRGQEMTPGKHPGTMRIYAIGDSNTLGWGERNGPNWPQYVGQLLDPSAQRFIVINAGVWGYTSFQGLRRFEQTLSFEPDVVLISFGSNDAQQVTISDADFVKLGGRKYSFYIGQALNKFRIGQLALEASDQLFLKRKEQLIPRVSLADYKSNLNEIIRECTARNIKVILLTRPYRGESNHPQWWMTYAPNYNAVIREVAETAGIPWIDVYSYFRDKPTLFADESHFTEAGHRLMAEIVTTRLKSVLAR